MIQIKDNVFHLSTKNTSYIFRVTEYDDLEHLYYGKRVAYQESYEAFIKKRSLLHVSTLYPQGDHTYGMDEMCFEYSFSGGGDMRESACRAICENTLCRFKYVSYSTSCSACENNPNPTAHDSNDELVILLEDEITGAKLSLIYRVFDDCNCITRSACFTSGEKGTRLERLMSVQLDLDRHDLKAVTFNGVWSRERHKSEQQLSVGKFVNDSLSGASSARHNPFIMLAQNNADNFIGDVFAFNLVYSGNHYELAEQCPYGKTRFLSGLNPQGSTFELAENEEFYTPEAVMTYSPNGYNGASENMHNFVVEHIVAKAWAKKEKPVLLNSWEAMYFDISEEKVLALADKAKQIGAELIVVDDGWFGKRNDDTTSLGDWFVNKEKFPNGIKPLADKIHEKDMKFGLWFEPEMISEESELFRKHPDWALGNLGRNPVILGRGQRVLDLSRSDVQDYIIDALSTQIDDIGIDYIKWDFNRMLSDVESAVTPVGAVFHKYVLGLYRVMKELTSRHSDVLFELCASGGARFDLGMLSYMPIGWTSDNTDVYSRVLIQEGTSYAYPPNVMCNHISICPNHQTRRVTDIESRFSAAAFGVMGLQYNLLACDDETLNQLKTYIERYKQMRKILGNARFYRLLDAFQGNYASWMTVSEDSSEAYLMLFQKSFSPVKCEMSINFRLINSNLIKFIKTENYGEIG